MSGWLSRRTLRTIHEFRTRLGRYKLQERRIARAALADDPAITAAVHAHMTEHGLPEPAVRRSVSANLALRLIQVHVCIIYLSAGLAKL